MKGDIDMAMEGEIYRFKVVTSECMAVGDGTRALLLSHKDMP